MQSPNPAEHVPWVHTPAPLHTAVALAKLHAVLHEPQSLNVVTERSQPLLGRPSQSAKPDAHVVIVQLPPPHAAAATLGSDAQLLPQLPQLAVVLIATSQPSLTMLLQSRKPGEHVTEHVPFMLQPAPEVLGLPVQLLPHAPQLFGVLSAASQPLPALLSQLPKPLVHMPRPHALLLHTAVAFALEHVVPHAPQLVTKRRSVSQPLAGLPSQLAKFAAHVI